MSAEQTQQKALAASTDRMRVSLFFAAVLSPAQAQDCLDIRQQVKEINANCCFKPDGTKMDCKHGIICHLPGL